MRHPSLAIAVITTLLFSTFVVSVPLPPKPSESHGPSQGMERMHRGSQSVCHIFQFSIPVSLRFLIVEKHTPGLKPGMCFVMKIFIAQSQWQPKVVVRAFIKLSFNYKI